jgi:hypothetical protein
VAGECALKSTVSKMKGTRCGIGSLGKRKVVRRLFDSAPHAWRRARQAAAYGVAAPAGAVAAAWALSDEGDDARGGPSWAQSKNGPEDLMGHHGEVGRDGLLRWQARKMKKKLERTYGLQRSTGRIEMGCGKIPFKILNQGFGFK